MYRFLIIDDEPLVREGISTTIDWNAHGFELVGACRDGREGLQALEELRPDVVLTDICMPFVDGLELAASISEQYPGTRTILLTGYDEFEYAQEAVRLNVHDFILKPVTAAELREVLDSLRRELDEEKHRKQDFERLQEQLRESIPVFRERFLNSLVKNAIPLPEAARKARLLDLDVGGPVYIVLVCDRDRVDPDNGLDAISVQNEIVPLAGSRPGTVSFSTPDEETLLIISLPERSGAVTGALERAEAISDHVQRVLGRTISIGIGDAVESLSDLPHSYRTARIALEQRFVLGPNQVITMQQVRGSATGTSAANASGRPEGTGGDSSSLTDAETRQRLTHALKTGASGEAVVAFRDILQYFRRADKVEHCHVATHRVLADAMNALDSIEIDYREIPGVDHNPFGQLGRMKTIDEMEQWFLHFIRGARDLLDRRRQQLSQRKAVAAESFIRENYHRPDLSLQMVCSALAVSKSYLSPIFKSHTGMTFVEYLTAVRIREAEALLGRTDLKVYEIAEKVGYRDAHYFSLTFRKQAGVSPSEYREQSWERVGT
ncbi:MAG: response regulator [Spirochaetaceae bacterium]|nr:MAG: response regulator [Spirochaetaceae bacterium]